MKSSLAAEINRLSAGEKLLLVEELWDQLASNEDSPAIPPSHERALAEDQSAYQANPLEGSSWSDVKHRITGKA